MAHNHRFTMICNGNTTYQTLGDIGIEEKTDP